MIIERYLFKELATTLAAVTSVLFLIFVSSWFARLLGQVAAGSIQSDVIFLLLSLKSVDAMMILLPLAFYLAVLLAFGRLYKDSEMTAMLACGVSLLRVTKLVFWAGLAFAVLVGSISLYFGPLAKAERYQLQKSMAALEQPREKLVCSPGKHNDVQHNVNNYQLNINKIANCTVNRGSSLRNCRTFPSVFGGLS